MIYKNKVVLRLTPNEALLISQALTIASRSPIQLAPGLGRWYAKLGETILAQADRITNANSVGSEIIVHELEVQP